jgi:hypothetical protein
MDDKKVMVTFLHGYDVYRGVKIVIDGSETEVVLKKEDKKNAYNVDIDNDSNTDNITINIFKRNDVIKPKVEKVELSKEEKTKLRKRKVHNDDIKKFNDDDVDKFIKDNNLVDQISLPLGEIFNKHF